VAAKKTDLVTMTTPGKDCVPSPILYLIGFWRQKLSGEVEGYDDSFR
jgi:hypothetical protein